MRVRHVWFAAMVIAFTVLGNDAVRAQNANANQAFTVAPGGKVTIDFESFCIDYGKKFPDQVGLPPSGVADPAVVGVLNNALAKGYTSSNAKEVQFAIWKARGATDAPQPGNVGNELAQNLSQPAAPQGATSVIDAIKNNQVKATAGSWQGVGEKLTINNFADNFQGRGQITLENTSGQSLTLYMPVGTVFPAPSAQFQSMAGYAINVSVNNPQTTPQQTMPDTGLSDLNVTQLVLIGLIGVNIAAIGIWLQGRARLQR